MAIHYLIDKNEDPEEILIAITDGRELTPDILQELEQFKEYVKREFSINKE